MYGSPKQSGTGRGHPAQCARTGRAHRRWCLEESGVPTFRDALDGLWAQYDPMQLATPTAFARDPKLVWDWYEHRRVMLADVQPNLGHHAIAALERLIPEVLVVTQNIDGLHQCAGSTTVVELHGNIHHHKCAADCRGVPTPIDIATLTWDQTAGPPTCPHCGALARPDVVWFGEMLPEEGFARARHFICRSQALLRCWHIGLVQPAASLPRYARNNGVAVIDVNPNENEIAAFATVFLQGPAGTILPQIVAAL